MNALFERGVAPEARVPHDSAGGARPARQRRRRASRTTAPEARASRATGPEARASRATGLAPRHPRR